MRCTNCGSRDITVVGFTANDGATYRYCRYCETGAWESEGTKLAATQVLEFSARIEPGRRRPAAA